MKIHDIILIIYLKSLTNLLEDSYKRRYLLILVVVIDNKNKYEVKKFL